MTDLFSALDPAPTLGSLRRIATPLARQADPETSHDAGEEITASGERQRMMAVALAGLRAHPGCTAKELEKSLGYEDGAIRKRLSDLRTAGAAINGESRLCTITKKPCQTWWAV